MKKLILFSVLVFSFLFSNLPTEAYAQAGAQTAKEDSAWFVNNYHKMERMIPIRTG